MTNAITSLIKSRKFLLALFAVATTIVMHYFEIPPEVWVTIDALVMILINAIAKEDAAEKSNPSNTKQLPNTPTRISNLHD